MPSKKSCSHLLVVAHPDDETLFFAGLLQSFKDWQVVCVTDGNADGLGSQRQRQFHDACKALKVRKVKILNFPDLFESRLKVEELIQKLKTLGKFKKIFTHSILGEYGHRHHQDVSFATHQAFGTVAPVFSLAYNCFPQLKINLTSKQYALKTRILWDIYSGETKRLINYLPAHSQETFIRLNIKEIEEVYFHLTENKTLNRDNIKAYRWLIPYLESGNITSDTRLF